MVSNVKLLPDSITDAIRALCGVAAAAQAPPDFGRRKSVSRRVAVIVIDWLLIWHVIWLRDIHWRSQSKYEAEVVMELVSRDLEIR
jgi:hypothetical protein